MYSVSSDGGRCCVIVFEFRVFCSLGDLFSNRAGWSVDFSIVQEEDPLRQADPFPIPQIHQSQSSIYLLAHCIIFARLWLTALRRNPLPIH